MPRFKSLNFRYSDAEEEQTYAPELIEQAYVDTNEILENIRLPENFLVIGPKGSGKTALSSKLTHLAKEEWSLFVAGDLLEQFEFQLLKKTGGQRGASIGGALTAWQLILFLRIKDLFMRDERLVEKNNWIPRFSKSLGKHGLGGSSSLTAVVQQTSRRGIFGKIKTVLLEIGADHGTEERLEAKDPAAMLEAFKGLFAKLKPAESSYYLLLDGLDYVLRDGRNNTGYIADLINAARQMNIFFASLRVDAKVIVLVRDEVLQVVPDPNLTKRVNDNGIQLRWYDQTRTPFETDLLKVIQGRAHLAGYKGSIKDLWSSWFPSRIHNKSSLDFVIVNTRFLPRDLISFFRELQRLGKEPPFREVDVLSALNTYSDWFLRELSDSLVGLINEDLRVELPGIITELGLSFSIEDLSKKLKDKKVGGGESAVKVASELFNACWVGNVWETSQGRLRFAYRHRKVNARLNLNHKLQVHPGLWKTLNLI